MGTRMGKKSMRKVPFQMGVGGSNLSRRSRVMRLGKAGKSLSEAGVEVNVGQRSGSESKSPTKRKGKEMMVVTDDEEGVEEALKSKATTKARKLRLKSSRRT
ncbi:hypothetical protein M422DRAFT_240723 [Sphaerobolus stellatus SS14]|nr:hypothetical protein M422DRAFT_240723 [Sphaerobolus stellatus SS14]